MGQDKQGQPDAAVFQRQVEADLGLLPQVLAHPSFQDDTGAITIGREVESRVAYWTPRGMVPINSRAATRYFKERRNELYEARGIDAVAVYELTRDGDEGNYGTTSLVDVRHAEETLVQAWQADDQAVRELHGDALVMRVGTAPYLHTTDLHIRPESNRFRSLEKLMSESVGGTFVVDQEGPSGERLHLESPTMGIEGLACANQGHLNDGRSPGQAVGRYKSGIAYGGALAAVAGNSPYIDGVDVGNVGRYGFMNQVLDPRPPAQRDVGFSRAFQGTDWPVDVVGAITEIVRLFPGLLPIPSDSDSAAQWASGRIPDLESLRLMLGTVWNPIVRLVIDTAARHVRTEMRIYCTNGSPIDNLANEMLGHGVMLADNDGRRPSWADLPFRVAMANLDAGCLHGLQATVMFPDRNGKLREWGMAEHLLEHVVPLARHGLVEVGGMNRADAQRYLQVVVARAESGVNGSEWQRRSVRSYEAVGASRWEALQLMSYRYAENQRTFAPMHGWAVPAAREAVGELAGFRLTAVQQRTGPRSAVREQIVLPPKLRNSPTTDPYAGKPPSARPRSVGTSASSMAAGRRP